MRVLSRLFFALVFAAAGAAPAPAQGVDPAALDRAIEEAAAIRSGDAAAYAEARARVLAFGEPALPALAERGAASRWTRENWRRALVAEACRVRLASPELAAAVDAPRGIDPAVYKKFRKPEPFCQHDLARLGTDAVPLLLERWIWTFDERPFSAGEAGLRERRALGLAALFVPGHLADARARFALEEALRNAALPAEERRQAAVSLGQCAGTEALPALAALFDDALQPIEVREGCAWGLGRVPAAEAGEALFARLAAQEEARLRRAVLQGISLLGDRWAWEARGAAAAEAALALRRACAETLVRALRSYPADRDIIGAGLATTAWPESLFALRALAQDETAPGESREAARAILPALEASFAREK